MLTAWGTATIVALGTAVLGARGAAAQGTTFDGTLTYVMHSETGKTATLVTATKGQKIRVDVADPANPTRQAAFLIDAGAHTRTILLPSQKKYITIPESMAGAMAGMGGGMGGGGAAAVGTPPKFTFTKTGRTETVAGVSCEVIHGTGTANDGKTVEGDVCVAKGVGFNPGAWAQLGGGQAPGHANMDAIRDAIGPGNGVLKMTSTKDGKQEFELEVTKIDRASPSDDIFTPPADYTTMSMGGMPAAGTKH
jgi:hypothetical protein